jgi:hypothetical protein
MASAATEQAVNDIVTGELGPLVGSQPDEVDPTLTFSQAPPQGYGLTNGAYASLCDNCTAQINTKFGCNITLSGPWRTQHYNQTIAQFIADAANLVPAQGGQ